MHGSTDESDCYIRYIISKGVMHETVPIWPSCIAHDSYRALHSQTAIGTYCQEMLQAWS